MNNTITQFLDAIEEYELRFGCDIHSQNSRELIELTMPGCGLGNCAIEERFIDSAIHVLYVTDSSFTHFFNLCKACKTCPNPRPFAVKTK